jgi:hypothetical protein
VSGAPARLAGVRVAERPAGSKPSQDRTVLLPGAVAVLDGASTPDPSERDGGWYADQLAGELAGRLPDLRLDLSTVLADAIAAVASAYRLVPGSSPSSTVTLLRWDDELVDGLVLGDSPLVVFTAGRAEVLVDERLDTVAPRQRVAYHDRLAAGGGYDDEHRALLRELVGEQRRHRNHAGGYWIAEATPTAAGQALVRSWPAHAVTTAVLATDGVSRGIGRAVPDWPAALALVDQQGADALLDAVRAPERADPDGRQWPRAKPYDDQALIVVSWGT